VKQISHIINNVINFKHFFTFKTIINRGSTVTGVPNNNNGIDGTFTDNYVYLITMGYKHTF